MALASITWPDVTARAPELAGTVVPLASQAAILADVDSRVRHPDWGGRAVQAKALLAAHLATMLRRGGAVGPVVSNTMGPGAVTYGAGPSGEEILNATSYGAEFLRLRRSIAALRGPVAVC